MYNSEQQTESLDAPRQLAEKGDAEAQYKLGTCYYKGIDIEPNAEEAFKWFVTAAKRKQLEAMFRLAHCYEKGIGTKSSQAKAIHWRYWAMNRMPSNPNDAYDSMETPMCGRIKVRKGGKYGYMNDSYRIVIPCKYFSVGSFDANGHVWVNEGGSIDKTPAR